MLQGRHADRRDARRGRQGLLCDARLMHDLRVVGRLAGRATGTATEVHGSDQGNPAVLVVLNTGGSRSKRLVDGKVTGSDCVSSDSLAERVRIQRAN